MTTWYLAHFLDEPYGPFGPGERIYVSQVGAEFEVCDRHGAYLTRLNATDAARLLKSERDPLTGNSIRVEDVEILEAHIALKNRPGVDVPETTPHSPGLRTTVRFMSGVELAEMGLPVRTVARKIVGWRCFRFECNREFLFTEYPTFREQPRECPACGCMLFEAVYQ